MKLKVHDRWFHKKPKVKKIKICEGGCGELAKNSQSKYCLDCTEKRRLENQKVQSKKKYERYKIKSLTIGNK